MDQKPEPIALVDAGEHSVAAELSISIVKARDYGVGNPTVSQITVKNAPHRLQTDRRSANLALILGQAGRLKSKDDG